MENLINKKHKECRITFRNVDKLFVGYIFFALLYQLIQLFQGLSPADTGVYLSGYKNYIDDTYCSEYLNQYWLTYYMTGYLVKALSINTFIGLRVLHVIFNVLMQIVIYLWLKKYIAKEYIVIGLFISVLAHFGTPYEINYNDYSVGLLIFIIMSYYEGLRSGKLIMFVIAGILTGLSFFFRLANLTFIGIPIVAIIFLLIRKEDRKGWLVLLKQIGCFFFGVVGIVIVVLCFSDDGLRAMKAALPDILAMGTGSKDVHGASNLIKIFFKSEFLMLRNTVIVGILFVSMMLLLKYKITGYIFTGFILMLLTGLFIKYGLPADFLIGASIFGVAIALIGHSGKEKLSYLLILSLYIPIIYPLGSAGDYSFHGTYLCYLSLPLAIKGLCENEFIKNKGNIGRYGVCLSLVFCAFIVSMVARNIMKGTFQDESRIQCVYPINGGAAKWLYTNKDNAEKYNYLINVLNPVIKKQEYLICNFSISAISILNCKPYAIYTTQWISNDALITKYLMSAYRHTGKLPYILIDRKNYTEKDEIVFNYCKGKARYEQIWRDGQYSLFRPMI